MMSLLSSTDFTTPLVAWTAMAGVAATFLVEALADPVWLTVAAKPAPDNGDEGSEDDGCGACELHRLLLPMMAGRVTAARRSWAIGRWDA